MRMNLACGILFDQALGDAEFGRVDKVVGGVDPENRRGDCAKFRFRIVISGSVHVIQKVVGVGVRNHRVKRVVDVGLGLRAGGRNSFASAAELSRR